MNPTPNPTPNVIHAFGSAPKSQVQEEMLQRLATVTEEVRAGRVLGVAIACLMVDGNASRVWAREDNQHWALIGSVQSMNHDLIATTRNECAH
jgi:hypothetical protein